MNRFSSIWFWTLSPWYDLLWENIKWFDINFLSQIYFRFLLYNIERLVFNIKMNLNFLLCLVIALHGETFGRLECDLVLLIKSLKGLIHWVILCRTVVYRVIQCFICSGMFRLIIILVSFLRRLFRLLPWCKLHFYKSLNFNYMLFIEFNSQ